MEEPRKRYRPPYGIKREGKEIIEYISCRTDSSHKFPTEKEAMVFEEIYNILAKDALNSVKLYLKERKIPQKLSLAYFVRVLDTENLFYPTKGIVLNKTDKIVKKLKSLDFI